jgi:hypothetical protein
MIKRLEKAGLGFYVRASETQQRLGIKGFFVRVYM